eukprot:gnl/TRDRNA2_/TRDRNA2_42439_c0_seq1.p1 gnl/TRDRNA2_/TRDRNA2_42439_c0~~gnl/TRDRNA2_/TRDRNA2_42439_c0_seq1.p1  ORF type:complete len:501 (+),score=75.24 gnl/TRDRNA2_/TRDRNA2_42439_c0_seq1:44-1504(+)
MGVATETTPLTEQEKDRQCCTIALRVRILTSIISLAEGYDIGVVNGAVILFKEELGLEAWQVGVALSIFPCCVAINSPIAATLGDWAGRKPAMIVSAFLLVVGCLLMATATNFWWLVAGRATAGSGAGIGLATVTAYMSEVSPSHARGFYSSLEELFVNVGNVMGYLANAALLGVPYDWRIMLGIGAIPAFFVFLTLLFPYSLTGIPESPRYLQKVGRHDEAKEILLELLHGDEEEVEKAFAAWLEEAKTQGGMATWGETFHAFFTTHRRVAAAGVGGGMLNMFTGIMLMMVMTTTLLVGAGLSKREAMWISVGLGATKALVMLIVAYFFLDTVGRRPLFLTSLGICSVAASVGLGAAALTWGDLWVIIALLVFSAGYSIGVGPVPWVYSPEVFENRFRAKGVALGISGSRAWAVTHLFLFPLVFPLIGLVGFFIFLFTVNVLGAIFVILFVPETKGRSLEEIHEIFHIEDSDEIKKENDPSLKNA